jgi:hypothetical protein
MSRDKSENQREANIVVYKVQAGDKEIGDSKKLASSSRGQSDNYKRELTE